MNIDIKKCNAILKEWSEIESAINEQKEKIKIKEKELKTLLPKGYWWSYDIDTSWNRPKKYSIREISVCNGKLYITVKEVFKKAPWKGFDGKRIYLLDKFIELNIYKTEEEAKRGHYNRICPKCGGIMKYASSKWCAECMIKRENEKQIFERNHMFYHPEEHRIYQVKYTDELSYLKGFYGRHFIMQRLDTMEIIHTDNLWSLGFCDINEKKLPEIKFLENIPEGNYISDFIGGS